MVKDWKCLYLVVGKQVRLMTACLHKVISEVDQVTFRNVFEKNEFCCCNLTFVVAARCCKEPLNPFPPVLRACPYGCTVFTPDKRFLIIFESDMAGGWTSRCRKETLVGFNYVMSVCFGRRAHPNEYSYRCMNINECPHICLFYWELRNIWMSKWTKNRFHTSFADCLA